MSKRKLLAALVMALQSQAANAGSAGVNVTVKSGNSLGSGYFKVLVAGTAVYSIYDYQAASYIAKAVPLDTDAAVSLVSSQPMRVTEPSSGAVTLTKSDGGKEYSLRVNSDAVSSGDTVILLMDFLNETQLSFNIPSDTLTIDHLQIGVSDPDGNELLYQDWYNGDGFNNVFCPVYEGCTVRITSDTEIGISDYSYSCLSQDPYEQGPYAYSFKVSNVGTYDYSAYININTGSASVPLSIYGFTTVPAGLNLYCQICDQGGKEIASFSWGEGEFIDSDKNPVTISEKYSLMFFAKDMDGNPVPLYFDGYPKESFPVNDMGGYVYQVDVDSLSGANYAKLNVGFEGY